MLRISIINLGTGNISSVFRAFKSVGAELIIIDVDKNIPDSDAIVFPGVGNFRSAMNLLKKSVFFEKLTNSLGKIPFLGICLGMQFLAEIGEEGGFAKGASVIPGRIVKLPDSKNFRIPHMGWDDIDIVDENPLFFDMPDNPNFYFVHSYYFQASDKYVSSYCNYGIKFASSVQKGNIFGVQFHPEKSQKNGMKVISNFCNYLRR